LARGLTHSCPNCGGRTLFPAGGWSLRINRSCAACGLRLERDEGGFLGAMSLNYGVTILVYLVPVLLLYLGEVLSGRMAAGLAIAGTVVFPVIFYRSSRSWWLMNYYLVVPHHLPANQRVLATREDANT
jgi:uncharacterized protein (DUF983 family)